MLGEDFSTCSALVVDGNSTTRSVLLAQLRDLGVGQIVQSLRTADARRQLETHHFDYVLCEQNFADGVSSGQDLLDDLRRNNLLPFSTIFIMITSEASYMKVAEAAESALDGYLLKPHKTNQLLERMALARKRKRSLQAIFNAIDANDLDGAAALCVERYESRGLFWLYSARIGAELLLRLQRYDAASALYQSVDEARGLPWAKLGMARALLESGQLTAACTALEKLVHDIPDFGDAYDVLGHALFEQGQFDRALDILRTVAELTPSSISRMQSAAMMTFYRGAVREAEQLLDRTTRIGLDSKMFDPQTLVLLALARYDLGERRPLQQCESDINRLAQRDADNGRTQRLAQFVHAIVSLFQHDDEAVLSAITPLSWDIHDSEFDIESGANMIGILARMRVRGVHFNTEENVVRSLAHRFCSSRATTELLAAFASAHEPYREWIRTAQADIAAHAENAMAMVIAGDTRAGVARLLAQAQDNLNVRLIDNAYQLLTRPGSAPLDEHEALMARVLELRRRAGAGNRRLSLGRQLRQSGGLVLRVAARPPRPGAQRQLPNAA